MLAAIPSAGTLMIERRKAQRHKSFLRGCIYFNNRHTAVDCLIRDISPLGARLVFSDAITTPDVVELYIAQKEQTLRAQVHWRHGTEMGVGFAQPAQVDESAEADLTKRVERLEAEIATLKRLVKRLKTDVDGDIDAA
jgi:hypothetical protein